MKTNPANPMRFKLLFEMISQRYERGATLISSNLPFDEWTKTFGTERLTELMRWMPPPTASHMR